MIKYIGSKRRLLPTITRLVRAIPNVQTVVDYFSGTARVGHALKRLGYRVLANDHMRFAHALATCYVATDREKVMPEAARLVDKLNDLPGVEGYFTETFCRRSRFFRPENGKRVDAIRRRIAEMKLDGGLEAELGTEPGTELEAVLLTSLMEAADRVDSTTGVQMAYLKSWAPRAYNELRLRMPDVLPGNKTGKCRAYCLDAATAADRLEGDLAYVDPPYNQHSYLGNYHIWETLVRWDDPEFYGVACKRMDCKRRKSDFNSRVRARNALGDFLRRVRCRHLIVSFNNEGHVRRAEIEEMLEERGHVSTIVHDYKRYVGAQIGIHGPDGRRVGRVSHLRNHEYIFVVCPPGEDQALETIDGWAEAETQRELFDPAIGVGNGRRAAGVADQDEGPASP